MPDAEFSEFSYAFAVTHGIQRVADDMGAGPPLLPSLVAESELGFDVALPSLSLFFQYKLSKHLVGHRAKQLSLHGGPYYRFALHHRSPIESQHNTLVELAKRLPWAFVAYAAPAFNTRAEFTSFYQSNSLLTNSCFLPVAKLGTINDHDKHFVTFSGGGPVYAHYRHSREAIPGREKPAEQTLRDLLEGLPQRAAATGRAVSKETLISTRSQLLDLARTKLEAESPHIAEPELQVRGAELERMSGGSAPTGPRQLYREIIYLARVEHGLDWIVMRRPG